MIYKIFIFLTFFIFILYGSTMAGQKKILALYKSNENTKAADNPVLNHFGKELKELGYEVDYKDALGVLPSSDEMKQYEGIITFYFGPVHPQAKEYINWLSEQVKDGRKVIILGNFGAHSPDGNTWLTFEDLNDFFFPFGLSFKGGKKVSDMEVIYKDPDIISSLPSKFPEDFLNFSSINSENKAYLKITSKDFPVSESELIVRTPYGAMAQIGYIYSTEPSTGNIIWHLNKLKFLHDVLEYKTSQKPSVKTLLCLYKGSDNQSEGNNFIRRFAAESLVKLGYQLDYRDIEKEIPSQEFMKDIYGVLTWYVGPSMYHAGDYCEWLGSQIITGKKVIILGNFGAYMEKVKDGDREILRNLSDREFNNFFYPFGLKMEQQWTGDPDLITCDYMDKNIVKSEFLNKKEDFKNYFMFKSLLKDNEPCLTLSRKDIENSKSDVIVITPYGGMALEGYIYRQNDKWEIEYIIDMDKFFASSLKEREFIPPEIFTVTVDTEKELKNTVHEELDIPSPNADTMKRKILVLYKGSEFSSFDTSPFYVYCDVILNHLGLICDYVDIEHTRPDESTMEDYRGIITWFITSGMKGAEEYNKWLSAQIDSGKKIVILDNYGAIYDSMTYEFSSQAREVLNKLGVDFNIEYFNIKDNLENLKGDLLTARHNESLFGFKDFDFSLGRPDVYREFFYSGKIIDIEKNFFDFEQPLKLTSTTGITPVRSIDEKNRILLRLHASATGEMTPAVTGPWGGILLGEFFYRERDQQVWKNYEEVLGTVPDDKSRDRGRWVVNPFLFFSEALSLNDLPKLDYTTLNGQRIFYSHLDGDGLLNRADFAPETYAGEIIFEEIFKKYNLPISASVITEEMEEFGSNYYNPGVKLARNIFSLDNIEVATHTHTHPFDLVEGSLKFDKNAYKLTSEPPSPFKEVLYSTALINQNLVPDGKKTKIVFWPGECNPTEEFLLEAEKLGLKNINGGDPLYDEKNKSYSNLCNVLARVGQGIQVHTSGSNDYIYTGSWTGDYGGMIRLLEHIKDTDSPVRIEPVNIYYHYYSGSYQVSLDALHSLYNYVLTHNMAPLFASQYSSIVEDFYYSQIDLTGDGGYIIRNMGYLRTVRFDNTNMFPDLEKSEDILGFNYYNNSLYVFLGDSKEHKIYLTEKPQRKPYLKSCSHYINNWIIDENHLKGRIEGLGAGSIEIANMAPGASYHIKLGEKEETVNADKEGLLKFNYELTGKPKFYELEVVVK